jgi:nucleotidyltransferase AbiEii toxin of type IV toxin-antitoxin system
MSALFDAARDLQAFFEMQNWRFSFIGGLAVLRWGEPRFTRDIDVTLLCPYGSEDQVSIPLLKSGYKGRISDAKEFAQQNRVLILQDRNDVPIDISLGALTFEESLVERSTIFEFMPGCELRTCSAEDLLVLKLFAFRPRDILDAETIVIRQRGTLDWSYVETNLQPLAEVKGQAEIMKVLEDLKQKH